MAQDVQGGGQGGRARGRKWTDAARRPAVQRDEPVGRAAAVLGRDSFLGKLRASHAVDSVRYCSVIWCDSRGNPAIHVLSPPPVRCVLHSLQRTHPRRLGRINSYSHSDGASLLRLLLGSRSPRSPSVPPSAPSECKRSRRRYGMGLYQVVGLSSSEQGHVRSTPPVRDVSTPAPHYGVVTLSSDGGGGPGAVGGGAWGDITALQRTHGAVG
jgi:hypothetical protein